MLRERARAMSRGPRRAAVLALGLVVAGCASNVPMSMMQAESTHASNRERQTRLFRDIDEPTLLTVVVRTLQDQGYQITVSAAQLGVVVGTKRRSHRDVLSDIPLLSLKAGLTFGLHRHASLGPPDQFAVICALRPSDSATGGHAVRVTFYQQWHRVGPKGIPALVAAEPLPDAALYEATFRLIDGAIALERHAP